MDLHTSQSLSQSWISTHLNHLANHGPTHIVESLTHQQHVLNSHTDMPHLGQVLHQLLTGSLLPQQLPSPVIEEPVWIAGILLRRTMKSGVINTNGSTKQASAQKATQKNTPVSQIQCVFQKHGGVDSSHITHFLLSVKNVESQIATATILQ